MSIDSVLNNLTSKKLTTIDNFCPGTPGAPRILSAEPSNFFFGSIDITWSHTPCINRNGDIKAYRLQVRFSKYSWVPANSRSPRSDPQFIEFTFQPSALLADSVNTYTITDLVITAEYHISVAAVTRQGTIGRYSPSIVANASHPQGTFLCSLINWRIPIMTLL